jgi:hypothetical protein
MPTSPTSIEMLNYGRLLWQNAQRSTSDRDEVKVKKAEEALIALLYNEPSTALRGILNYSNNGKSVDSTMLGVLCLVAHMDLCTARLGTTASEVACAIGSEDPGSPEPDPPVPVNHPGIAVSVPCLDEVLVAVGVAEGEGVSAGGAVRVMADDADDADVPHLHELEGVVAPFPDGLVDGHHQSGTERDVQVLDSDGRHHRDSPLLAISCVMSPAIASRNFVGRLHAFGT